MRDFSQLITLIAVTCFLQANVSYAAEPEFQEYGESPSTDQLESRISSLENEIQWLRHNHEHHSVDAVERELHRRSVGTGGLFGSVEVSFLRPYLSGSRSSASATGGKWVDPTYATGLRYALGYENDSGVGVRARYFGLDDSIPLAQRFGGGSVGLDVESIDVEATFRKTRGDWDAGVSGGVRYGNLEYTGDGIVIFPGELSFEGFGPTISVDGRRSIGDTSFSVFGNLRGSLLMGELGNTQPVRGLSAGSVEDEIMHVIENQIGVSWLLTDGNGPQLEVRAAWETQFWLNNTIADDVYGIGSNLALSGPAISVELRY